MSDIRFNRWLHQSGTGGIYQDSSGNIGIGTSVPTSALDVQSGSIKIGTNTLSSSGVSTFTNLVVSAGTTSAPSISPSGDSNTGIFFPAPDTVAIGEGGVEVIRIDSNSNVGVGTLSPTKKLDVVGDARITGILTAGQYNITTHVPIQNGTFSTATSNGTVSGTFTIPVKSNCLFSFNGTAFRSTGNDINMTLSVTGIGNLSTVFYFTNETSSHKSSPTGYATATLNAGTWTVVITCDSNTDYNDRGNCSVLAIPTL